MQKNHSLNVSPQEIKVYIAILLLTGYLSARNIRMFWEVKQDTHNQLVASAMRQNRFLEIHQYLHAYDNLDLQENDKFAKLVDYFSLLNTSFLENFQAVFSHDISYTKQWYLTMVGTVTSSTFMDNTSALATNSGLQTPQLSTLSSSFLNKVLNPLSFQNSSHLGLEQPWFCSCFRVCQTQ